MSGKFEFLIPVGLVALLVFLFLIFSETEFKSMGYVLAVLIFIIFGSIIAVKRSGFE